MVAQMSCTVEGVTRQLESEIQAAAMSTAVTAGLNTHAVVEGMRQDVQVQLEQNRVDAQRRDEETGCKVDEIVVELANLTKQLNEFKPVSEAVVGKANKQVSDEVNTRLNLQSERIDLVDESVKKKKKTASDNAEILQNLLIGLENMG